MSASAPVLRPQPRHAAFRWLGPGLIMALVSVPFAFVDRPLLVIVGSLFIPFLAATMLFLNNLPRRYPAKPPINESHPLLRGRAFPRSWRERSRTLLQRLFLR